MKTLKNKRSAVTLALCLSMSVATFGQNQVIKMSQTKTTVSSIIKAIEKQTQMSVDFSQNAINLNKTVTLDSKSQSLAELMGKILKDNGNLTYKIVDRHIIIVKGTQQGKPTTQKASGKFKITGQVLDANGESIIGATVMEQGTKNGIVTDIDGNFVLNTSKENPTLDISYIGFLSQQVKARSGVAAKVTMKENAQNLEELVVVGYGTMKKKDMTGAVASVKMGDEPVNTVSSVSHALAGKAAGLQVSTISAQPGSGASFRVRGAASVSAGNDPLIIIDGFPVSAVANNAVSAGSYDTGSADNILGSINPNDIESIEVLKDASSTAIYGARAGNGVIIITTKHGKTGAPKITYSATATMQVMAKKYEVLNAHDFMEQSNRYAHENWMKENQIGIYGGRSESEAGTPYSPYYTQEQVNNPVNDTDWFDLVTRSGFQTQHNVSMNGGNDFTKYLVSLNYFKQNGVVKNSGLERYTGRVNLDQKLSKTVKTGVNLTFTRTNNDDVALGAGQNENASVLVGAAQFNPLLPVKDDDGKYVLNQQAAYIPNPVSLLDVTNTTTKERFLATAFLEYNPIKELTLKANLGIDRNYQKHRVYMPKTTLYGSKKNGQADIAQYDKSDYLMELTANYTKRFGEHNITALAGYSFQRFTDEYLSAGNSNFLIDGFLYNNLGAGTFEKPWVGSSATKNEMASFFGRVNYSFKDRYLMTATLRADGASNFAENHRWGYFPSVALGWRFNEEEFMKGFTALSNGKLRLSWGQTGNSNIGNRAVSYYSTGYEYAFGNVQSTGVYLRQLGNPSLKWETTTEWNLGLDLGFFNNRLNLTAEYYNKTVSDLLATQSLLSFHEVGSIAANIGKTQSQGFELTINSVNFNTSKFNWTTDLTFSFYRDKWKERDPNWKPSAYSQYHSPIRYMAGYVSDGLIQAGEKVDWMPGSLPGQVKLKDINGYVYNEDGSVKVDKHGIPLKTGKPDGKLNDADKVIYGNSDPGYLAGLNNTIRYGNFDLNIYFYGQFNVLNNGSYKDLWLVGDGCTAKNMYRGYNMPTSVKDVWSSDNQSATRPGYFQSESSYGVGDYFLQKSWFVRCRNITLGYTIPASTLRGVLSSVRIYADVNNPFVISPYKGLDLETDNSVFAYPNVRSFTLGVDITF